MTKAKQNFNAKKNKEKAANKAAAAAAKSADTTAANTEATVAKLCSCTMGDCLGGPDPACATGLAECMYGNAYNQCEGTSLKYPASMGGEEMTYIPGCPMCTLAGMCANCEWLSTQDFCYDSAMSESFQKAYPMAAETTTQAFGAPLWPHTLPTAVEAMCTSPEAPAPEEEAAAPGEEEECPDSEGEARAL